MIASCIDWVDVDGELKPFKDGQPVAWAPQPGSQQGFLACSVPEVLYFGNRGGGKTECLLMDFAQHIGAGFGAEWRGVLFRQTYPQLGDVIKKANLLFPRIWPGAKFNQTMMTWTWPTGEALLFRHMSSPEDYNHYHGHAYPWIGWEELTTWPDDQCYRRMFSCCRSTKARMPRKVRATTNPYGSGFNWVKARWMLPLPPGTVYGPILHDPETGYRCAIQSSLAENKVLLKSDPQYTQKVKAAASNPAELAAWLDGSWDIVSGGMFDDVWLKVKERAVIPPFSPPASYRIDTSFDWGSSKPFSVGIWAQSDGSPLWLPPRMGQHGKVIEGQWMPTVRGDLFRIGEWYGWSGEINKGCKMLARDIATGIVKRLIRMGLDKRCRTGIADASIFDEDNGNSIAADMAQAVVIEGVRHRGVYFDPADKRPGTRKLGWEEIRTRLANVMPEDGRPREEPGLFVTTDCVHWLRTVPSLPRDPRDMDDVDTDCEDHVADETRYRCRKESRTIRSGTVKGV